MIMQRKDFVIKTDGGTYWKSGGTFTTDIFKATMFGEKDAAVAQLDILGFEKDEVFIARVTKTGTRRVK